MNEIKSEAERLSREFLADTQYRLGFLEAEQPNPLTKTLGETCRKDTRAGLEMLISVDRRLADLFENALHGAAFARFAADVRNTLSGGGRVIISGCGSSGRLAMRLEASFLAATKNDRVLSLMTGGDYTLIRAVESFEDDTSLAREQARTYGLSERDLLIGVTATGETTSVLGTAAEALDSGAHVWMIVCTDPASVKGKLKRVDDVFGHPHTQALYLPCGGMAVTGSTRMQSSTIEQAVIAAALELTLPGAPDTEALVSGFRAVTDALSGSVGALADAVEAEAALYERGGHVTYFADEYLLDTLSDTTERGPTFSTPPFRPQASTNEPLSWAFVKNPFLPTEQAWEACFGRLPRCLEGQVRSAPPIGREALYGFRIGRERDPEREAGDSLALWIGESEPEAFSRAAAGYKARAVFRLRPPEDPSKTQFLKHLYAKMMLNTFSTAVMAKIGRIYGNYMVYMSISNKKLVDRGSRMIADLCSLSYEEANRELFESKLLSQGESPVKMTVDRLRGR